MDTLEWGYNDEELRDIDEFDLEQYGFQYDGNFSSNGYSSFGDLSFSLSGPMGQQNNQTYNIFGPRNDAFSPPSLFSLPPQPQPGYNITKIKEEPMDNVQSINPNYFQSPGPVSHKRKIEEMKKELSGDEIDIEIDGQPPSEVRTRTPSETRTFSVSARVLGNYKKLGGCIMKIALWYERTDNLETEPVKKDILGGTKTVPVLNDGTVLFDNLTISESSTKHKEREFCLELTLLRNDGVDLLKKRTRPFYAYSHKKVLQRRGSVKLRTLSKSWGRISGGDQMHVIGSPFIQGPALSLIIRTPHGDVLAKPLEYYSDSVLFFELPPYPLPEGLMVTPDTEFRAQILVTNDGRTYSNAVDFVYISDSTSFRSRI